MSKIVNVRTSVKPDKTLAVIRVEGEEKTIFLTAAQVKAATGLKAHFQVLKGSDITVTYYAKGEKLSNGQECTEDNTIVKEFEIEVSDSLTNMASAAALGMFMKA